MNLAIPLVIFRRSGEVREINTTVTRPRSERKSTIVFPYLVG